MRDTLHESGVIQLEFSGTQKQCLNRWKHMSGLRVFHNGEVHHHASFINMCRVVLDIFSAETVGGR